MCVCVYVRTDISKTKSRIEMVDITFEPHTSRHAINGVLDREKLFVSELEAGMCVFRTILGVFPNRKLRAEFAIPLLNTALGGAAIV